MAQELTSRDRRKFRVRRKIKGTAERPRLNIFRSYRHMYAQLINDETGTVLVAASTLGAEFGGKGHYGGNMAAAAQVGKLLAEKAKTTGIIKVVFDRNGYRYHGRVKALADGAREGGLEF